MKRILFIVAIVVALAGRANAQIAYRNSWSAIGNATMTTAVVTTGGTQAVAGDIEIFAANFGSSNGSPPTGGSANAWTQFITNQARGDGPSLSAWWKLVAAGDIGATFTFVATSVNGPACVMDFSGVNTTTPIDTGSATTISTGNSTTSTAASITLVSPSDVLLFFNLPNNGAGTTTPTNFTVGNCAQAQVNGTTYSLYIPYQLGVASGATGTVSSTVPSGVWGAMLGGLAPAATPTPTPTATATPTFGKGCGNAGGGMCANQTIGAETGFTVSPN